VKKGVRKKKPLLDKIYSSPKYKGKHVVAVSGKVFSAKTGEEANKLLEKVMKKYPRSTPTITYVPKDEMLVL